MGRAAWRYPTGMADLEFQIAERRTEPITFTLGGDPYVYTFTPPKQAVMMMPVLMHESGQNGGAASDASVGLGLTRSTFDWLGQGLNEADNDYLLARLKNPEDSLDVPTLTEVVEKLSEQVGARPTT